MTRVAEVKIHFWEKPRFYPIKKALILSKGDAVILETEYGLEMGEVLNILDSASNLNLEKEKILRKAKEKDLKIINCYDLKKEDALKKARKRARECKLPIKIIDASFTACGKKIIFVFIADGRVDFRNLVRFLSKDFQKGIRMQQVGSRDEVKKSGDIGVCGRRICCGSFLKNLESITTNMARTQQIVKQGNQRITGICGRLMCCLAFEEKQYGELSEKMPEVGEEVETKEGRGTVIDRNILKQTVVVEILKDKNKVKTEIPVSEL